MYWHCSSSNWHGILKSLRQHNAAYAAQSVPVQRQILPSHIAFFCAFNPAPENNCAAAYRLPHYVLTASRVAVGIPGSSFNGDTHNQSTRLHYIADWKATTCIACVCKTVVFVDVI